MLADRATTTTPDGGAQPSDSSARATPPSSIAIVVRETAGIERRDEPVTVGVPLTAGRVNSSSTLQLRNRAGQRVSCQFRVLAQWPDGSVKWVLATFLANAGQNEAIEYQFCLDTEPGESDAPGEEPRVLVQQASDKVTVKIGTTQFQLAAGGAILDAKSPATDGALQELGQVTLTLRDARGTTLDGNVTKVSVEETGPQRASVLLTGHFGRRCRLGFRAALCFYARSSRVRIALTLQNHGRARHPGGYWDLGDPGSVLFKGLSLAVHLPASQRSHSVSWKVESGAATCKTTDSVLEIYQDSSGGENWQSRNHVNRNGQIPLSFQGYRVRAGADEIFGLRASPTVALQSDRGTISIAPLDFWQKFPAAVIVEQAELRWEPFPTQASDLHELQAGENSTHVAWLDFAAGDADPCRLAWAHAPLEARCAPNVYASSGAVPYLPDEQTATRPELITMLADALEGPRNFFHKREVVDEYGWRNYGDTWADHEEVYYTGPHRPIISHYNNQFDVLYGTLVEYLRSGDQRWWELADPLARHVMDIDVYHTDRDRAAYSGGLFWPTTHYYDAGTASHRTMAREMSETGSTGVGGGPGSEHNFASGLLLYYYLTGDTTARDTVVGLADWVIAMDDGERHFLSLLSGKSTGIATNTTVPGYYGPGRAAANSLVALLDGYLATGRDHYLDKADEIIRRTIHPHDAIETRQLDWVEVRWSYTMFLQALVRYLDVAGNLPTRAATARYAQQSILHYARWMAQNEQFVLDHPEKLEFPTETWAAQELRKGVVLWMAARLAEPAEREMLAERGRYFSDRAWNSLLGFATRAYTRPLALVLSQGYLEAALDSGSTPLPRIAVANEPHDFGEPAEFVPQKAAIRRSMKSPLGLTRMLARCISPGRWANVLSRSWLAERFRMKWNGPGRGGSAE
ncbi:MAG: glycoside hydrolase family 127 protein [Planctomycetes bacterium]|nr:glycoside hydrolase family 127 protein [Planctomycetota bacterium]